jgi:hypothetical protein
MQFGIVSDLVLDYIIIIPISFSFPNIFKSFLVKFGSPFPWLGNSAKSFRPCTFKSLFGEIVNPLGRL